MTVPQGGCAISEYLLIADLVVLLAQCEASLYILRSAIPYNKIWAHMNEYQTPSALQRQVRLPKAHPWVGLERLLVDIFVTN
ncbi:hypothetical protein BDV27DRAFT_164916 [Aspergillus caelatus]|uniref:Uncharacterized protein n=1 Tax=Aspergillus caelatus TaxID=61420 RepID=A0A5N6ZLL0_9EURO|nr:uncharacterized protein BDV27DRAFT_164916 [Aspergillus caelatus]KAE8357070.1 hypothetical protein BDV27DRAFT_164916 [Aspergillus caelatus]